MYLLSLQKPDIYLLPFLRKTERAALDRLMNESCCSMVVEDENRLWFRRSAWVERTERRSENWRGQETYKSVRVEELPNNGRDFDFDLQSGMSSDPVQKDDVKESLPQCKPSALPNHNHFPIHRSTHAKPESVRAL